jgi:asparagine synthase (glutamine-hydrolysing)
MCGIAGLIGVNAWRSGDAVHRMTSALSRRGPDGEGVEKWNDAVLGHRRLSIFDLSSAGLQPMLSPDRVVGVVFNGAIYNFHELRAELAAKGWEFRSRTDTEVLIHGYREWGIDRLVSRLHGMFAFGIWDDAAAKFFLVRDRLGVKPLYYAVRDGLLAFASTARALRAGGFVDELDDQAVVEYLEFGYVTDDRAIYKGAAKVPAGTILEWSGKDLRTRSYWDIPSARETGGPSFEEAVAETERLFLRAVELRLEADVPVGALLSGGVDSSLVCWAIARLGADITAFTVGTPGDAWDETADATATARTLGIKHQVIPLSAGDTPDVGELATAYGEPFACASALGMLRVSKAVKASATVLLTGDGGDDVFLGYPEHRNFWMAQKLAHKMPGFGASAWQLVRNFVPAAGPLRRARHFLDYAAGGVGAIACAHDGLPFYWKSKILGERLAGANVMQRAIPWSHESGRRVLADFLLYDRQTRFPGEYMTKVDGGSMYYALEARSPFLDQELWNYVGELPFELRLHGGTLKAVLREIARRNIGERVAGGAKRGFGIPVQKWLAGRWRSAFEELLRDSILEEKGYIRTAPVLAKLRECAAKGWAPNQLWYLYVLEAWLRREREERAAPPVMEISPTRI